MFICVYMLIFVLVFYPLSLTFWLILSLMSHTCFKEAIAATAAWIQWWWWWGGGLQQNVFHNIIPPVLGCICMPRLGTATRIGFSPQYRQKAALETQKDVWLSKVLLQWCRIIHALILILKYILYIFALFLYSLGGFFLCKRVSLLTVLAYKTVFLKRLLG